MKNRRGVSSLDRDLGMHRPISRRDFLQGTALSLALPLIPDLLQAATGRGVGEHYPPTLTGLRGSHSGSFEVAHALRDGPAPTSARDIGEHFDLVVVGGGISGLSAAHFYLATKPHARILILENHDDFGGHARRNEFHSAGRMMLMNGGTLSIESPTPYSAVADGLLKDIGIDRSRWESTLQDKNFYASLGLNDAVFFDRETFGADKLVARRAGAPVREMLVDSPLNDAVKRDIERIEDGTEDHLPGLDSDAKKGRLAGISYQRYLLEIVRAEPKVCDYYGKLTHGLYGLGIDAVSALDCWGAGLPGFQGLNLKPGSTARMGYTAAGLADNGWSPEVHFPDGNATVARSLVRRLVPAAIPGKGVENLVVARADYSKLDHPGSPVRIRLNSTAINVQHVNSKRRADGVGVTYVRGGQTERVHARHCVLACWNMVIPYLCPELPAEQKTALHAASKTPLLYISVALRNWQAFAKLRVNRLYAPGSYYSDFRLNEAVGVGSYVTARDPGEPMLIHVTRTPCAPGLVEREQNKIGRADILATSFETYERNMREQLGRMLNAGGFDPARDITAITVNRWPHGYTHETNPLFEPMLPEAQRPHVVGRRALGSIAIANADAAAASYTDAAIDQAHRAIADLNI